MFAYCPLIEQKCAFATDCKDHKHCGLKTGDYELTKIHNLSSCPKPKKKRGRR